MIQRLVKVIAKCLIQLSVLVRTIHRLVLYVHVLLHLVLTETAECLLYLAFQSLVIWSWHYTLQFAAVMESPTITKPNSPVPINVRKQPILIISGKFPRANVRRSILQSVTPLVLPQKTMNQFAVVTELPTGTRRNSGVPTNVKNQPMTIILIWLRRVNVLYVILMTANGIKCTHPSVVVIQLPIRTIVLANVPINVWIRKILPLSDRFRRENATSTILRLELRKRPFAIRPIVSTSLHGHPYAAVMELPMTILRHLAVRMPVWMCHIQITLLSRTKEPAQVLPMIPSTALLRYQIPRRHRQVAIQACCRRNVCTIPLPAPALRVIPIMLHVAVVPLLLMQMKAAV
mmetsp:Transcript_29479/g.43539  ORF Transcript_29479/g.43539 Transcript_29479/m.43539 type:complete len:346 (-) Transcript_29479:314-1351(-)